MYTPHPMPLPPYPKRGLGSPVLAGPRHCSVPSGNPPNPMAPPLPARAGDRVALGRRGVGGAPDDFGETGVPRPLPARRRKGHTPLAVLSAALALAASDPSALAQTSDGFTIGLPAGHVLGQEVQIGAGNVHPSKITPGANASKDSIKIAVIPITMGTAPDVTVFSLVEVRGPDPDKIYAVQNVQFVAYAPATDNNNGATMVLGYNGFGDITNMPPDGVQTLGRHVPYNPVFNEALQRGAVVTAVPLAQAFPAEAAADPQFATKFAGYQHVTITFADNVMMVGKGPFLIRPHRVLTSPTASLSSLINCDGDDPQGMETHYSKTIADENGDPQRVVFSLDTNWRPSKFSIGRNTVAVSVGLAEVVPVTEPPPPPPTPTVFRSDAAGTPSPTGDHVSVVVVSDGHPFWTAERADVGPGSAWTLDQTAPYAAPAGEPVRITKPLGAARSFRSTVRFAPGQEPRAARQLQH